MKEAIEGISMGEERGKRREGGGWATGWGGRGDGVVVMCDGVGVGVGGDSWGLWGGRGEERREWMGGVRAGMGNVDGWDCLVALM